MRSVDAVVSRAISTSVVEEHELSPVHSSFHNVPIVGWVGFGIVGFWILVAVFAPWLAPYDPSVNHIEAMADPTPSLEFPLGLDSQGRDILSRITFGARTVLAVAPAAVAGAVLLGSILGLIAGYYRGWIDVVISRACDIMLSLPTIILYLIVLSALGASALNIILVIAVTKAPMIARIVRGLTLELMQQDYIAAAKMRGEGAAFVMVCELLPNMKGPLTVEMCLRLGYTIIAIGMFGFLGLGLPPPTPDWGSMIRENYSLISIWPHMSVFPCIAVSSLVIGVSLTAIGLREGRTNG
jgi:peptide/nickel transport system permease protein